MCIRDSGLRTPVPIFVESAGEESGDFAHIWVNGRDVVATPGEPGYYVAVMEPRQGTVQTVRRFNTLADPAASNALAAFIRDVPIGCIVAVAVAGGASPGLGAGGVNALHGIRAAGGLRRHLRLGYAIHAANRAHACPAP